MGQLLSYTINSSVYLAILYIMYKWFIADKNNPGFNRHVILAIYIAALTAPLLPGIASAANNIAEPAFTGNIQNMGTNNIALPQDTGIKYGFAAIAICMYAAGTALALAASLFTYIRLVRLIRGGEKATTGKYTIVLNTKQKEAPFSWFKYIVLNKADYNLPNSYILTHEKSHMREELKTVHEYQADATVVKSGCDIHEYQMLLIKKAAGARFPSLANSLNHSKLKKRITMMYKSKSRKSNKLLVFATVPALIAAYCLTTNPAFASVSDKIADTQLAPTGNDKDSEKNTSGQTTLITVTKNSSGQPDSASTISEYDNTIIEIDGKQYPGSEINRINKNAITQITVKRNNADGSKKITLMTNGNNIWLSQDSATHSINTTPATTTLEIDGKIYPKSAMSRVNPDAIKRITVTKDIPNQHDKITIKTKSGMNIWLPDSTVQNQ
ncbi:hypothetical protein [uncultured Muribaculum sp.]|uniref:hypothetical protein n=1 Tax=uncultured Muribaculum sp. TaxID=1918613 RepID=UPI0027318A00|nr:hypothetical protein [uncultured Muribaculum sp.]